MWKQSHTIFNFMQPIWPLYPLDTAKCWMSFTYANAASDELGKPKDNSTKI